MKLNELLDGVALTARHVQDVECSGICCDTRDMTPGCLFVALPGYKTDGHRYIRQALERAGVVCESEEEHQLPARQITKTDLYLDGFSGGEDSRRRRQMLLKRLRLPERLSANGLLPVLNAAVTYEEYRALADSLNEPAGGKDREDE